MLQGAKRCLAALREDLLDGDPRSVFDLGVQIDQGVTELDSQLPADGGLSRTHETRQEDTHEKRSGTQEGDERRTLIASFRTARATRKANPPQTIPQITIITEIAKPLTFKILRR